MVNYEHEQNLGVTVPIGSKILTEAVFGTLTSTPSLA